MDIEETNEIIRSLAEGKHPSAHTELTAESIFQEPRVIRALFTALEIIEHAEERDKRRRTGPQNSGKLWTQEEDDRLAQAFDAGMSVKVLAAEHQRSAFAIKSRLLRLGKITESDLMEGEMPLRVGMRM